MAIAIVDDTPLNLTLIQALVRKLTPPETELVTFSQPLEGLQWCASNEPDLLIVDYMMPDINGIDFIRTLRKLYSADSVPILMVTSETDQGRLAAVEEAGVSGICDKPFEPAVVRCLLARMLSQGVAG